MDLQSKIFLFVKFLKKGLVGTFFLLIPFLFSCRTVRIYSDEFSKPSKEEFVTLLPSEFKETSGLLFFNNKFWSINDSGGLPVLYSFSQFSPAEFKSVEVKNRSNYDWEELAEDDRHFYIGDFGNNFGSRDTLDILKIKKEDVLAGAIDSSELISFSFAEKTPSFNNCRSNPFDCEAMVAVGDSLWIFTKNWQDETSWLYKLPKVSGYYQLKHQQILSPKTLITGATLNQTGNVLWLVGYHNFSPVILAYEIQEGHLKLIYKTKLFNRIGLQTEGITIDDESVLWISYEKSKKRQGLLKMKLYD
jgi:hypothetical protein